MHLSLAEVRFPFPPFFIMFKIIYLRQQIDLRFINRYSDTWPPAIACMAGGILGLKKLVSHTVPLERAMDALNICADAKTPSIKVLVVDEVDATL